MIYEVGVGNRGEAHPKKIENIFPTFCITLLISLLEALISQSSSSEAMISQFSAGSSILLIRTHLAVVKLCKLGDEELHFNSKVISEG